MKTTIPPQLGALPRAELSLLGRRRWNAQAALFAALVLVALVVRRWRCAEVDELNEHVDRPGAGGSSLGLGIGMALLLASAMAVTGLLVFSSSAMPVLAGSDVSGDPAVALVAIDDVGDGVVESTREIPDDSPLPGVEVRLRTRDGASHLFTAPKSEHSAGWRTGERVIYIAGRHLASE